MGSISSFLDLWGLRLRRGRPGFCREACHVQTPEEYLPELKDPAKGLEFRRGQFQAVSGSHRVYEDVVRWTRHGSL